MGFSGFLKVSSGFTGSLMGFTELNSISTGLL